MIYILAYLALGMSTGVIIRVNGVANIWVSICGCDEPRPVEDALRAELAESREDAQRMTELAYTNQLQIDDCVSELAAVNAERDELRLDLQGASNFNEYLNRQNIDIAKEIGGLRAELAVCRNKLDRVKAQGIFIRDHSSSVHHLTDAGKAIIDIVNASEAKQAGAFGFWDNETDAKYDAP